MTIPVTALAWGDSMDPSDQVDYVADFSALFDTSEMISDFTVVPYSESALLGLSLGPYAPNVVNGTELRVWFQIDPAYQSNSAFDGSGTSLPVLVTFNTTSVPPRRRQRTLVVKVQQR